MRTATKRQLAVLGFTLNNGAPYTVLPQDYFPDPNGAHRREIASQWMPRIWKLLSQSQTANKRQYTGWKKQEHRINEGVLS